MGKNNKKKSISDTTYRKLEKAIDDLDKSINQRSSQVEINEILKILNESANQINELIDFQSIKSVNQQISEFSEQLKETQNFHKRISQLYNQTGTSILDQVRDQLKAIDFRQISLVSLFLDKYEIEHFQGLLVDLSNINTEIKLDDYSKFGIKLNQFKPKNISNSKFLLNTTSTKYSDIGFIKFNTFQNTQLEIESLKKDFKELKNFVYEDAKNKDEMFQEMLDYHKGNNQLKLKKIKYIKKRSQLIIDQKTVDMMADTTQHYICNILFSSKKNLKRSWEVIDLVEALNEDTNDLNNWTNKIYQTIRHLNEKIEQKTGFQRFIIYSNKTVVVNPKYTDKI